MTHNSLPEWLSYLESIHPNEIDLGLSRVETVAQRLNIQLGATVITVGGTNGKGTTSALIEQALILHGQSVGVYSSPHLLDYRERVRVNGALPNAKAFCNAFEQIERARGNTTLTYFEFGTLAALLLFNAVNLDVVILEVGLGGRLDATNIVTPDIAVITSIGLDHQAWLGDTRELIAIEKAGIIREQGKVVIGECHPPHTLEEKVAELGADAWWIEKDFFIKQEENGLVFSLKQQKPLRLPQSAIPSGNIATALAVLHKLAFNIPIATFSNAITQTNLPGRRQLFNTTPATYLDVGHNPQATRSLAEWLNTLCFSQLHIVVAMLNDKDAEDSMAAFAHLGANYYTATTYGARGLSGDDLADAIVSANRIVSFNSVVDAYHNARACAQTDDLVLVIGSFHTVAEILALPHNTSNG